MLAIFSQRRPKRTMRCFQIPVLQLQTALADMGRWVGQRADRSEQAEQGSRENAPSFTATQEHTSAHCNSSAKNFRQRKDAIASLERRFLFQGEPSLWNWFLWVGAKRDRVQRDGVRAKLRAPGLQRPLRLAQNS